MSVQNINVSIEETKYYVTKPDSYETVADLIVKISWLNKVITKRPLIPIVENILFAKGVMYASDLQVTAMAYTSIKGEFMIPGKKLLSVLKTLKKADRVSFSNNQNNVILRVNDQDTMQISMSEAVSDFPNCHAKEINIVVGEIPSNIDLKSLDVARGYVSQDELRTNITRVFMNAEHISATNGHFLLFTGIQESMFYEQNYSLLFPTKAIELIKDFEHSTIKRNEENSRALVKEKEKAVVFNLISETYPDYKNIIPKHNPIKIEVDQKSFLDAMKLGLEAASKVNPCMRLSFRNGGSGITLSTECLDESTSFNKELPASIEWGAKIIQRIAKAEKTNEAEDKVVEEHILPEVDQQFAIGFNLKLMMQIITDIKTNNVELTMSEPNKAIIINNTVLLMPMMLSNYA
jgi:DNA polymerase III sliding clamp (beta) subunit (PCNA family)